MQGEDLTKTEDIVVPEEHFEEIEIPFGKLFAEKIPSKGGVMTLVYKPSKAGSFLFSLSSTEGKDIKGVDWKRMGIPLVSHIGALINRNPEGSKNLWNHNTYWIEKGFGPVVLSYMSDYYNFAGESLKEIYWRRLREVKCF